MQANFEREKGQYPLSIGTSLAVESYLNVSELVKHRVNPYTKHPVMYANVKTLFRNLYGSIHRDLLPKLSDKLLAQALLDDMTHMHNILRDEGNGASIVFYIPDYRRLDKINSETLLRLDNTSLQRAYTNRMRNVLDLVVGLFRPEHTNLRPDLLKFYDTTITDHVPANVVMLTHYPYDLLAHRKFNHLVLLESHTGNIKGKEYWYTKYYHGKDLPEMPFRLDLLTLLGDNIQFRNKVRDFRTEIIRCAKDYHWTTITTTGRIRQSFESIKNHELRRRMLSVLTDQYT